MSAIDVTFSIKLHKARIHLRTLQKWVDLFNLNDDMFIDRIDVAWDEIYYALAMDHLSGGDWSEYVIEQGYKITDWPTT